MGMFDTFWGSYKCDYCKTIFKFQEQTKDYENLLEDFYLGDYIDRGNRNYFYDFEYECPICKAVNNLSIAIRRGQYVDVISTKAAETTNILEIDNIEDGYQRNREYEKKCQDKLGWDERVKVEALEQHHIGEHIEVLGTNWKINEVYTEQVKDGVCSDMAKEFFYGKNYVYRVSDGDVTRIIKESEHMLRTYVRVYEDSIGAGTEMIETEDSNHYWVSQDCILKKVE